MPDTTAPETPQAETIADIISQDYAEASRGAPGHAEHCAKLICAALTTPTGGGTETREAVAAWLLGRDEASTTDEIDHYARHFAEKLPRWIKERHSGDCTKESHSCVRCIAERAYADADALAALAPATTARAVDGVEALREAVLGVVRKAHLLLDETEDDGLDEMRIDRRDWDALSAAMDALEATDPTGENNYVSAAEAAFGQTRTKTENPS